MATNVRYQTIYRDSFGHLRLPFAQLGLFLKFIKRPLGAGEKRALGNMTQFVYSLMIFTHRMRFHLTRYRTDSWIEVSLHELFLDTQSLFLFVQQFLEDIALILRMSLPDDQRHGMSPKFRKVCERLREQTLPQNDPFKQFLDTENAWLAEIRDLRDDICHRTAFDKSRVTTFPDVMEVMLAGGGKAPFISGGDLRSYITALFDKTLALACLAEGFVYQQVAAQHPESAGFLKPPAVIVAENEIDFTANDREPEFELGTVFMTVGKEILDDFGYFLDSD